MKDIANIVINTCQYQVCVPIFSAKERKDIANIVINTCQRATGVSRDAFLNIYHLLEEAEP